MKTLALHPQAGAYGDGISGRRIKRKRKSGGSRKIMALGWIMHVEE
jgi:hypothetical protein